MLPEFCLLSALTLSSDKREVLRDEINEWMKLFLPKSSINCLALDACTILLTNWRLASVNAYDENVYTGKPPTCQNGESLIGDMHLTSDLS